MILKLGIAAYFLTGVVNVVIGQDCSNQTVTVCLRSLTDAGFSVAHIDDDLPTWNETETRLRTRCQAYKEFSQCMDSVIDHCTDEKKYQGWNAAYKFLCEKSDLTSVAGYLQCYAGKDVVSKFNATCYQTYDYKVKVLQNGTKAIPMDKWFDYCKVADGFFTCVNETVNVACGSNASSWQWTWDRELNWPTLNACPGWTDPSEEDQSSTSAWTIALIVVLVLISIFMIFVIVFLFIFLFKKRKQASRLQHVRRRAATAVPPPPYSAVVFTASENGAEPEAHLVDASLAVRSNEPETRAGSSVPASDVVLPPLYVEHLPPAPAYEPKSPEGAGAAPAIETHSADGDRVPAHETRSQKSDEGAEKRRTRRASGVPGIGLEWQSERKKGTERTDEKRRAAGCGKTGRSVERLKGVWKNICQGSDSRMKQKPSSFSRRRLKNSITVIQ